MIDTTMAMRPDSLASTAAARSVYAISPRRIRDMPEHERPRELMERDGVDAVSDRTLLAIILRSGARGQSVVDLADQLLRDYGSLGALAQVSVDELTRMRGLGRVKAQVVKAALELARRLTQETGRAATYIRSPADAARLLGHEAATREEESFWVFMLDTRNRLRRPPLEISKGILDASLVHPREVFKEAIRSCSAALILAHNHPSGDPTPSAEDLRITRKLVEAGKVVDIQVLDHVVLGRRTEGQAKEYVSLRESGLVDFT